MRTTFQDAEHGIGDGAEDRAARLEQRASKFNRRSSVLLIVLITALAFMPAFMARELKKSMQVHGIKTHQKSINPSTLPSN
jgi:hypothetical protein